MKKILALFIVVVMCLSIAVPVSAAANEYTITIDNAVKGETYNAYKIFDVTYSGENNSYSAPAAATDIPGSADTGNQHTAYAYTITTSSEWWATVTGNHATTEATAGTTFSANGLKFTKTTTAGLWSVAVDSTASPAFSAATFATVLDAAKSGKHAAATVTANDTTLSNTTAHPATDTYYTTGQITLNVGTVGTEASPDANDVYKGPGYYFVDTSAGALCSLGTTEKNALIREKNALPTLEKKVSDTATGTPAASTDVCIGDLVYYTIVVTDGIGTDADIRIHDVMAPGLTLVTNSFKVLKGTTAVDAANYNIYYNSSKSNTTDSTNFASGYVTATAGTTTGETATLKDTTCTFEVVLKAAYVATLNTGSTTTDAVTITFAAVLNDAAVIAGEGNPNRAHLTYSNQTSPDSEAIVYTYAGALYKFSATEELKGAKFTMTKPAATSGADPIKMYFIQIDAGSDTAPAVYQYSSLFTSSSTVGTGDAQKTATDTIETPKSGAVVIYGLDAGTYTLTETAAPEGYNPFDGTKTLTVKATTEALSSNVTFDGTTLTFVAGTDDKLGGASGTGDPYMLHSDSVLGILNQAGTILPSTGGIGTTIFYVIGGILVAGAFVLLVTKRRMAAKN